MFTATGGSNSNITWSLTTPAASGAATIGKKTGNYTAGANGNTVDFVTATDDLGNTATLPISVGAGITITPVNQTVAPHGGTVRTFVMDEARLGQQGTLTRASGPRRARARPPQLSRRSTSGSTSTPP